MYSVFLSSYRNTRESLGELEKAVGTRAAVHVFYFLSSAWHFCGAGNVQKLELLNKQALRLISDDNNKTYETLLNNLNMTTLKTKRIQHILIAELRVHGAPLLRKYGNPSMREILV